MTVIVTTCSPEGIALADDSREVFVNQNGDVRVKSDTGTHVYQLGSHIAATSFGWSYLDGRTINSHIKEFMIEMGTTDLTVEETAAQLGRFLMRAYQRHLEQNLSKPVDKDSFALALFVAGYDPGSKLGQLFEVYIPEGEYMARRTTLDNPGAAWRGHTFVISRLLNGFDPRIQEVAGYSDELKTALDDNPLGYKVDYWGMTLQDAVAFTHFLVETTIEMQRFSDGIGKAPGASANCGGPVDVAVIDAAEGFRWVQRKTLRPYSSNAVGFIGES
jgi:hypothetical protein